MGSTYNGLIVLFKLYSFHSLARILGVFWYPAKSHYAIFQPIWKEFSLRGHQVTVITSFSMIEENLFDLIEIDANVLARTNCKTDISKELLTVNRS